MIKNGKAVPYICVLFLALALSFVAAAGICDIAVPDTVTVSADESGDFGIVKIHDSGKDTAEVSVLGVPLKEINVKRLSASEVYLGGDAIGVKLHTGGVIVVSVSSESKKSPAEKAGLKPGDIITKIDGKDVFTVEEVRGALQSSGGKSLSVTYTRAGTVKTASLIPEKSDGEYKAGMWIRDSTAGIGTVSYVTKDGIFASLGHGISDSDTGVLMPLSRGSSVLISVNDTEKGKPDAPGELKGSFSSTRTGSLISNTPTGLYGSFEKQFYESRELIKVGTRRDVHVGKAEIVSTVDESGPRRFDAEIVKIASESDKSKNFIIKITDKELIGITGGIVQGMSGSPIIQNGKLVGAVTHVMVSDPTKGFGIFIDNMLDSTPEVK